jgi:uncharacterized membrane protein YphA (DoxX/SURF4 family)
MAIALLLARLLLALVFAVAGAAKLADREGSRGAVVDFGVPSALAAPLGLLLPLAELAVAATLLPASTAKWGALGALALLSVFVVGISINLARGRTPECHCFGQLHSAPVGWKTLARNVLLTIHPEFITFCYRSQNVRLTNETRDEEKTGKDEEYADRISYDDRYLNPYSDAF